MAKTKTKFVCNACGAEFTKWSGQCADCGAWNTIEELADTPKTSHRQGYAGQAEAIQSLSEITLNEAARTSTGLAEFDRVLGGGLVDGSAILIGGQPGAGKSTLLLQSLCFLSQHHSTLYITGEESLSQVAMRAKRLGLECDGLSLLSETNVENILATAHKEQPKVLVIDSIQVMYTQNLQSAPGSVAQVREVAAMLTQYAKQTQTALFIVGHVTKDGAIAGPKVLEHMIDCSVMLESATDSRYRTLRCHKNRFGAVNELGVFAMTETGLKEVSNPSAIFLTRDEQIASGSVVTATWEGTRPLLVEIQALVDGSHLGNPRRITVGLDHTRLAMLLAVLHRHAGIAMGDQDVFANVVGGVKIAETSPDLALLFAVLSSFRNKPLPSSLIVFGEVGLSGEIRPVQNGQERLSEAAKHGFTQAIVPQANRPRKKAASIKIHAVKHLSDALALLDGL